jgi:hypothetical protein
MMNRMSSFGLYNLKFEKQHKLKGSVAVLQMRGRRGGDRLKYLSYSTEPPSDQEDVVQT